MSPLVLAAHASKHEGCHVLNVVSSRLAAMCTRPKAIFIFRLNNATKWLKIDAAIDHTPTPTPNTCGDTSSRRFVVSRIHLFQLLKRDESCLVSRLGVYWIWTSDSLLSSSPKRLNHVKRGVQFDLMRLLLSFSADFTWRLVEIKLNEMKYGGGMNEIW